MGVQQSDKHGDRYVVGQERDAGVNVADEPVSADLAVGCWSFRTGGCRWMLSLLIFARAVDSSMVLWGFSVGG